MKRILHCFLPLLLASCGDTDKLPEGVEIRPVGNDVIIFLEPDSAIIVRKAGDNAQQMIVSRMGNTLGATQLELGGDTPRSLEIEPSGVGKITVSNRQDEPLRIVFDDDGDGIPDSKIEGKRMYELEDIVWRVRSPNDNRTEQGADDQLPARAESKVE